MSRVGFFAKAAINDQHVLKYLLRTCLRCVAYCTICLQCVGGRGGDVRDFSPQQLAGVVWALAAMRQVDTVPFRAAWAQLLRRATEVPPAEPVLTQVWQVRAGSQALAWCWAAAYGMDTRSLSKRATTSCGEGPAENLTSSAPHPLPPPPSYTGQPGSAPGV